MRVLPLLLATMVLVASESPYPGLPVPPPWLAQEVAEVVLPADAERLRGQDLGWSPDELQRWFGTPRRLVLDRTGLDRRWLTPPPPAGVHPRVLFNPEDLPALRQHLTTGPGQVGMTAIRAHLEKVLTGPTAKAGPAFAALAQGTLADLPPEAAHSLVYEAFRCLIDEDAVGGRRLATVLATLAPRQAQRITAAQAKARATTTPGLPDRSRLFTEVAQEAVLRGSLGLAYDWVHGWMDDAQRAAVRGVLAQASAGMTLAGAEGPRAWPAGITNHIALENRLLYVITAIEGEDGYDPTTLQRCVDAQTHQLLNLLPNGDVAESWGKYFLFPEHLVILGKRGHDLFTASLRAVINDRFQAAEDPWGGSWTFTDGLTGTGGSLSRLADVAVYRALFPTDRAGDRVWRRATGGKPEKVLGKVSTGHDGFFTDALMMTLFARDLPAEGQEVEVVQHGRPLTAFSDDTGNLITRTAWSPDAVVLHHLGRSLPGGYLYADRSHLNLYALGRPWGVYVRMRQEKGQYDPAWRSVLRAGNEGPSPMPGRVAALVDTPEVTGTTVDLRPAWSWQHLTVAPAPADVARVVMPGTWNDYRRTPGPFPWMDRPMPDLPHWERGVRAGDTTRNFWWRRSTTPSVARRTALLARGASPYALVVDDLHLDDQPRDVTWNLTIAPDLVVSRQAAQGPGWDVVLAEPTGDRRLLIRVVAAPGLVADPAKIEDLAVPNPPTKDITLRRLSITFRAAAATCAVVLWPHREGRALPTTTGDAQGGTIAWPGQVDQWARTPSVNGGGLTWQRGDHRAVW